MKKKTFTKQQQKLTPKSKISITVISYLKRDKHTKNNAKYILSDVKIALPYCVTYTI